MTRIPRRTERTGASMPPMCAEYLNYGYKPLVIDLPATEIQDNASPPILVPATGDSQLECRHSDTASVNPSVSNT